MGLCKICNNPLTSRHQKKYCSRKCVSKAQRKGLCGNWKNGITKNAIEYRKKYKDYQCRYRIKNIKHLKKQAKKYYLANREKIRLHQNRNRINRKIVNPNYSTRFQIGKHHPNWKGGISKKRYSYRRKNAGALSIKIIQKIYEDNIKLFGTLTCIYCINPIEFGNDTLEHLTPLSRGGTNDYYNLFIACRACNSMKRDKLYEEVT